MGQVTRVVLTLLLLAPPSGAFTLDFDELTPPEAGLSQVPGATFTTASGFEYRIITSEETSSPQNALVIGVPGGSLDAFQEATLTFAAPTAGVSFFAVFVNSMGVIAQVDVFENFLLSDTVDIIGGAPGVPVFVDLTAYTDVTSIRVHDITDEFGLGYDDFAYRLCPESPVKSCIGAAKAALKVVEKKPGKEKLALTLKKLGEEVLQSGFGDPVAGDTRVDACLYDGADVFVHELVVSRAKASCGAKQKPCWKAVSTRGYKYKDPDSGASGVQKITEKGGAAGKGKLQIKARNNAAKSQDALPTGIAPALQGQTSATVQVHATAGNCFDASFGIVKKADGVQFKAKAP